VVTEPLERQGIRLAWSRFRRQHQARAKQCHAARRTALDQPPVMDGTVTSLSTPTLLLTEAHWQQIAALLPLPKQGGRPMVDSYPLLAGILWIMQTGAPWRALPTEFGHWHTAYTRYQDWQRSGLWSQILNILGELQTTPEL
jgi:hypothetical protein